MADSDRKTSRSWQEIAKEASCEKDAKRLLELTQELERAMDERDRVLAEAQKPKTKTEAA